jgi:hypothetical protein
VSSDYERFKARMARWDERAKTVFHGPLDDTARAAVDPLPRGSYPRERAALKGARRRCHNPRDKNYADYGGRGITVCVQWRKPDGFERFLAHIGPKPAGGGTLDRIDNARGYEPGNVRWASWVEQANNRRSSRHITWQGETRTAAEWGRELGLRRQDVIKRANRGVPLDPAANDNDTPQSKGDVG